MGRWYFKIIMLILILTIIGCSKKENGKYSYEEAMKKGDFVFQSDVENFDRFEQFKSNLSNQKADTIRITGYTTEGDPIFHDLQFDGKVIHYTYNNTYDTYGGEQGIKKEVCKELNQEESDDLVEFVLDGCTDGEKRYLFNVEKNKLNQPLQ